MKLDTKRRKFRQRGAAAPPSCAISAAPRRLAASLAAAGGQPLASVCSGVNKTQRTTSFLWIDVREQMRHHRPDLL
jgi:hypothetical protein